MAYNIYSKPRRKYIKINKDDTRKNLRKYKINNNLDPYTSDKEVYARIKKNQNTGNPINKKESTKQLPKKNIGKSPFYKGLIYDIAKVGLNKSNLGRLYKRLDFNEIESILETIEYIKDFPSGLETFQLTQRLKDRDLEQTLLNMTDTLAKTAQIGADISMQSKIADASYQNFSQKLTENTLKYNKVLNQQQQIWESRAKRLIYFGNYVNYKSESGGIDFSTIYKDWTDKGIENYIKREKNFSELRKVEKKIFQQAGISEDIQNKIKRQIYENKE